MPLVFLTRLAQYLKAYKYVKEFGEGIDRICSELETKGCAIPSFHVDAFILKATLMAEWTSEKEFDRSSTVQVPSNYRPSSVQVSRLIFFVVCLRNVIFLHRNSSLNFDQIKKERMRNNQITKVWLICKIQSIDIA